VEEVLKTAREVSADLIVMGTHGHGSVYNLLVGSVTEGILKASERPVLLVPAPDVEK
jgi:nucleotide-binding universal stress UspA family protein